LRAIQFMVERRSRTGQLVGPDEGIAVEDALRAYTVNAAKACGFDDLGTLSPGKYADLVLLSDDPRRADPSRIAAIEVIDTLLGGETQQS
jgi:predicted amidohydrolase YtcJ